METWKGLLVLTSVILLYGGFVAVTGRDTSLFDLTQALVGAFAGLYLGRWVVNKFIAQNED